MVKHALALSAGICLFLVFFVLSNVHAVQPLWTYDASSSNIESISLSSNGSFLLGYGGELLLLDSQGKRVWHESGAIKAFFLPAHEQFIAIFSWGIKSFDTSGNTLWERTNIGNPISDIAASPEGSFVGAISRNSILLYTLNGELKNFNNKTEPLSVAVSSEGSSIAVGTVNAVEVYSDTGTLQWRSYTRYPVAQILFSPIGSVIATAGDSILFLLANGTVQQSWMPGTVQDIDISNGGYVAAGSSDGEIALFTSGGEKRWKYQIDNPVSGLAVSSNGKYTVAGCLIGTIYVFNQSGAMLWNYKLDGRVKDVAISSDDRYLAAVSSAGTFYLFDLVPNAIPPKTTISSTVTPMTPTKTLTKTTVIPPSLPTTVRTSPFQPAPRLSPTNTTTPPIETVTESELPFAVIVVISGIVVAFIVVNLILLRRR